MFKQKKMVCKLVPSSCLSSMMFRKLLAGREPGVGGADKWIDKTRRKFKQKSSGLESYSLNISQADFSRD